MKELSNDTLQSLGGAEQTKQEREKDPLGRGLGRPPSAQTALVCRFSRSCFVRLLQVRYQWIPSSYFITLAYFYII